jgi:malate dehydrogenase
MPENCGKISIIGAGNVGASLAQRIIERCSAEVVLLDILEGIPQGKALDINQSAPILGFNSRVIGTNDYMDSAASDLVVITAGASRKPGMTRDELIQTNKKVLSVITQRVIEHSPKCIIIVVTNPADAMTYLVHHISRLPRHKVLGLSGVLDSARLSSFIAEELGVPLSDIDTCVIGEHGQHMVTLPRLSTVKGKPLTELLSPSTIKQLMDRTIGGGAEIVELLKSGSAYYAPSAAAARMAEVIALDRKEVLPCSVVLEGEYGFSDIALGVPVRSGRGGIEEIIELELNDEEKKTLADSAKAVQKTIDVMKLGLWE